MRAPTVIYDVWTSYNIDNSWTNGANWMTGLAPANDGTADILFDFSFGRSDALLNVSQNINSLTVTSLVAKDIELKATSGATLTIQKNGVTFLPSSGYRWLRFDKSVEIVLPELALAGTQQPWIVDMGAIEVAGVVSGMGGITKDGFGDLLLRNANTFTGGVNLVQGRLVIGSDSALGANTGILTLNGGTLMPDWGSRTIANPITLSADSTIDTSRGALTASGPVTVASPATIIIDGWNPVTLSGTLAETGGPQTLTKDGAGTLILAVTSNTVTGGATVNNGQLIFASPSSVPSAGTLTVNPSGYVGADLTTNVQTGFIDRLDRGSTGAFGFDNTANPASPVTVDDAIVLTGFNSGARLGSATSAILNGTITPQGLTYHFGNGGGTLAVTSALTDSASSQSLWVDSAGGQSLTLVLSGPNVYTGGTTVSNSLLRFSNATALPSSGSITLSNGSYLGFDYAQTFDPTSLTSFLSGLASRTSGGSMFILGFDFSSISNAIDLSTFSTSTIYLGTTTNTTLSGTITPTGDASAPWRFASVKGGQLTIASTLTGPQGVEIGSYSLVGSGSGNSPKGFVALTGNNTYSGGTTLYNGRLQLGNANALGSGELTVSSNNANDALLETSVPTGLTIGNSIHLTNKMPVTLNVGGPNNLTLNGTIYGNGGLNKYGPDTLTLNGANSFTFLSINQGIVEFSNGSATGGALLKINEAAIAAFLSGNPAISGLEGEPGAIVDLSPATTLTLNVPDKNSFAGVIQGNGGIVMAGPGRLELGAGPDERLTTPPPSTFSGGASINGGTVELRNGSALGSGTVTINGGKLNLGLNVTLTNPITFTAGAIGGFGTFAPSGGLVIGPGNALAPGMHDAAVGYLNFANGLTLESGGTYAWNIAYAGGANGPVGDGIVWDQVNVISGNLAITATSAAPFFLKVSTTDVLGASTPLPTFDTAIDHSWIIATIAPVNSTGMITGFDPTYFSITSSGFLNTLGIGTFFMSQSGNSLLLNFTPVPEPSTWALLLCGAGAVLLPALRRKRR